MIRYPNIAGKTEAQQLEQMRSYLHQLADELNFQLENVSGGNAGYTQTAVKRVVKPVKDESAIANFNDIKALIIKNADIINAYYDEINYRLEGLYVAEATFPNGSAAFVEQTESKIFADSQRIDQLYIDNQKIVSNIDGIRNTQNETKANIRTGQLYIVGEEDTVLDDELPNGTPVYGVEVGQETTKDGVEVFDRFARFTSYGVILYDGNGNEAAYITNNRTNIPNVTINKSMIMGSFVDEVDENGGIVTKWVGG